MKKALLPETQPLQVSKDSFGYFTGKLGDCYFSAGPKFWKII